MENGFRFLCSRVSLCVLLCFSKSSCLPWAAARPLMWVPCAVSQTSGLSARPLLYLSDGGECVSSRRMAFGRLQGAKKEWCSWTCIRQSLWADFFEMWESRWQEKRSEADGWETAGRSEIAPFGCTQKPGLHFTGLVGACVCGSVLLDVDNVLRAFQLTMPLVSPFK